MFVRLFVTFLVLVVLAVAAVGLIVLQQADGRNLFFDLARDVILAGAAIAVLAVVPAYLLARRFARPLKELTDGARRIAHGDFAHQLAVAGSGEPAELARAFNGMTTRLAATFAQVERDREQLRAILSGMVEGVVALGPDQRVLFANDRAGQLLDFDPVRAVGRELWELTRWRAIRDVVERAVATGTPQREELDRKGAVDKVVAVYVSRLPGGEAGSAGPAAESPGAVLVLHDTTDLRRLERVRQDFVANVSHELKTPLSNIKSSVEVLIDGAVEEPAVRGGFLREIAEQVDRQQRLIEDLISLARIESVEHGLTFESVVVEDAVHACLDRHRTRAEGKRHTLDGVALAGVSAALTVWADEEGLAQILDNLVDNAIKYTPDGGRVTVRWKATDEEVILEVEDTGPGIPEKDLPRIFERFYRVDKARSREMGGTGLGLSIVKHLAMVMNGTVTVTSTEDVGTTFRVTLPRDLGQYPDESVP